jgi:hypothetical protein
VRTSISCAKSVTIADAPMSVYGAWPLTLATVWLASRNDQRRPPTNHCCAWFSQSLIRPVVAVVVENGPIAATSFCMRQTWLPSGS